MSASASTKKTWLKGIVHWFDSSSGEGMIKSNDGNVYYVHSSAIESFSDAKSNKEKTLKDKQKVEFQLIADPTFIQVSRVKEV